MNLRDLGLDSSQHQDGHGFSPSSLGMDRLLGVWARGLGWASVVRGYGTFLSPPVRPPKLLTSCCQGTYHVAYIKSKMLSQSVP